jgi:TPR repeat protein
MLEEAVENTRTILRELRALPPWQRLFIPRRSSSRWPTLGALLLAALLMAVPGGAAIAEPFEDAVAALERDNYSTALQLLRPLAESGDPRAQYYLGKMYRWGEDGVPQDEAAASKWFATALPGNEAEASPRLGIGAGIF